MNENTKLARIATRFVDTTNQSLPDLFEVSLYVALAEYHKLNPLDLDRMIDTDDLYSLKHDCIGIYNKDQFFSPRFAQRG